MTKSKKKLKAAKKVFPKQARQEHVFSASDYNALPKGGSNG